MRFLNCGYKNIIQGVNKVLEHPIFLYFSGFANISFDWYTSFVRYIHMLQNEPLFGLKSKLIPTQGPFVLCLSECLCAVVNFELNLL